MSEFNKAEDKLLYHWVKNLVGTSNAFSINLFISLTVGLLYSFKVLPSPYILFIFGVISPIIFTVCMYFFIGSFSAGILNNQLPAVFKSRVGNKLLMTFDIFLVIGFALLIYLDYLNYFVFRFLQTVFFPSMLLVMLRVLYISKELERFDQEDQEDNIF